MRGTFNMKHILLIILGLFSIAYGQTIGYLRYDTVKMAKNGGTTELVLENSTKGTQYGLLQNKNNGRTGFFAPYNGLTGTATGVKLGGTMTENTNIAGGGFDFEWSNANDWTVNTVGDLSLKSMAGGEFGQAILGTAIAELSAFGAAGESSLRVVDGVIGIYPQSGSFIVDTLNNESFQNTLMGWTTTTGANRGKVGYVTLGSGLSLATGVLSASGGSGTVTSVGFTGGLISVANPTTTPAFTVAGTSGGIPYFSSTSTWVSSAALAANALVIGGGAGVAPATTTTGTGVLTFLGTPSSANLRGALTDENGTGAALFNAATSPTFTTDITTPLVIGGTSSGGNLTLSTTSHATKGKILFGTSAYDEVNNRLGLGTASPSQRLHSEGSATTALFKSTGYSQSTVMIEDPDGAMYLTNSQIKALSQPFVLNANGSYIDLQTGGVQRVKIAASTGIVTMTAYGAGTATFDASGNISSVSDVRLKNVRRGYGGGIKELMKIKPIVYKWNEKSGMETKHDYIGFSAQNVRYALGNDATGVNQQGYLSIQDRAIMATMINAIQELKMEVDDLKKQLKNK